MGLFLLLLGVSSLFGGIGHSVQLQMGNGFFQIILFIMNAFSLFAIYFCFRSAYTYYHLNKTPKKVYTYLVLTWIVFLLILCGIKGNFLIIKIHASVVLIYTLLTHYVMYKRNKDKGSELVVLGILTSFLPIIVHTLRLSFHEWFNHKDIAHVIMIISSIIIFKGAEQISKFLSEGGQLQGMEKPVKV